MRKISLNVADYQINALNKAKWDKRKDVSVLIREAIDMYLNLKPEEFKKKPVNKENSA